LLECGRYSLAVACYDVALKVNGQNQKALDNRRRALEELALLDTKQRAAEWYGEALRLWNIDRVEEAWVCLNRVLEIDPAHKEAKAFNSYICEACI
jgi:tetratricopeptide (TPR) repeat protein